MSAAAPSCPNGVTPPFPGLYIPHGLDQDGLYICSVYDAWFFTVLWTLIIYAGFYLAAAGYAFLVQVGASTSTTTTSTNIHSKTAETGIASARPAGTAGLNGSVAKDPVTTTNGSVVTGRAAISGAGTGEKNVVISSADRSVEGLVRGARRNWKVTIVIGLAYIAIGGIEAVLAGSVVGAILGTVYGAGGFRLSTWVPLVWAVINVIFLILSSFSIQERLL